MSSLYAEPSFWEVWLAYVRFSDKTEVGKVRPVVVLARSGLPFIVAKVTSAIPQSQYSYCELEDWEREGLLRPSRVQIAPLFILSTVDFLCDEALGTLSERDKALLQDMLDPHNRSDTSRRM